MASDAKRCACGRFEIPGDGMSGQVADGVLHLDASAVPDVCEIARLRAEVDRLTREREVALAEVSARDKLVLDHGAYESCLGAWKKERAGRVAAEASRDLALSALVSMWCQFAFDVRGHEGVWHDGGMSALEGALEVLEDAERLVSAGVPGKDWYRLASGAQDNGKGGQS